MKDVQLPPFPVFDDSEESVVAIGIWFQRIENLLKYAAACVALACYENSELEAAQLLEKFQEVFGNLDLPDTTQKRRWDRVQEDRSYLMHDPLGFIYYQLSERFGAFLDKVDITDLTWVKVFFTRMSIGFYPEADVVSKLRSFVQYSEQGLL